MSTSISIKGKTQGNESTTATVNYVNPNATNAQLVSLASALNNLTTNTISDVTKISKESLTDSSKLSRNMTIDQSTVSWATLGKDSTENATYLTLSGIVEMTKLQVVWHETSDNGELYIMCADSDGDPTTTTGMFIALLSSTNAKWTGTVTLTMPADDTYEEGTVTITITD